MRQANAVVEVVGDVHPAAGVHVHAVGVTAEHRLVSWPVEESRCARAQTPAVGREAEGLDQQARFEASILGLKPLIDGKEEQARGAKEVRREGGWVSGSCS